jgi:hypothetical protein
MLTFADYEFLSDKNIQMDAKATRVGARMHGIGVTCPTVTALKRLAAIVRLLHFGSSVHLDGPSKMHIAQKIKSTIKQLDATARRTAYPLPHLLVFPRSPDMLDLERRTRAYTPDDQPLSEEEVSRHVDPKDLTLMANDMCYRKTHKDVRDHVGGSPPAFSPPAALDAYSSGSASSQSGGVNPAQFMQCLMQMMTQMAGGPSSSTLPSPGQPVHMNSWRPSVTHRLMQPPANTTAVGTPRKNSAPDCDAEHHEEQLVEPPVTFHAAVLPFTTHAAAMLTDGSSTTEMEDSQASVGTPATTVVDDLAAYEDAMHKTAENARVRSARLAKERAAVKAAEKAMAHAKTMAAKASALSVAASSSHVPPPPPPAAPPAPL